MLHSGQAVRKGCEPKRVMRVKWGSQKKGLFYIGHWVLIMLGFMYEDRSMCKCLTSWCVIRDQPWPAWENRMGSNKAAKIRQSAGVFGFSNINFLILVALSMGNWLNTLVTWEGFLDCSFDDWTVETARTEFSLNCFFLTLLIWSSQSSGCEHPVRRFLVVSQPIAQSLKMFPFAQMGQFQQSWYRGDIRIF